ncbi:hypothetical protein BC829DRAFT_386320, partial [Chytridium lagenaria]
MNCMPVGRDLVGGVGGTEVFCFLLGSWVVDADKHRLWTRTLFSLQSSYHSQSHHHTSMPFNSPSSHSTAIQPSFIPQHSYPFLPCFVLNNHFLCPPHLLLFCFFILKPFFTVLTDIPWAMLRRPPRM